MKWTNHVESRRVKGKETFIETKRNEHNKTRGDDSYYETKEKMYQTKAKIPNSKMFENQFSPLVKNGGRWFKSSFNF